MKQKIINSFKLVCIYVVLYFIMTAFLISLFHTPVLSGIKVLMYRGIIFIIICGCIAAMIMAVMKYIWAKELISIKDIILIFWLFCCVNMMLFTLIPVTVERSISVFMLSYMEENDNTQYTKEDIEKVFDEIYVKEFGAFEKRINEQLVTGSIYENENGTYSISKRGKFIVHMFRLVATWFNTDQRLLYPK